jgi:hypothetical protein
VSNTDVPKEPEIETTNMLLLPSPYTCTCSVEPSILERVLENKIKEEEECL